MPLISKIYEHVGPAKHKRRSKKAGKKKKSSPLQAMPYSDYLKTDYWQKVRKAKFAQVGRQCQICGNVDSIQVHHKHYRFRGKELHHLDCLMVVCRKCHELIHRVVA